MQVIKHLKQLASESAVYGLSGIIVRFLTILLVPFYTRVLTPADYGVMSIVNTTVVLLTLFAVLALDTAAFRWFWDQESATERKKTIASWIWCQFAISTVLGALVLLGATRLSSLMMGSPRQAVYLILAAITMPLGTLNGVVNNYFRMFRQPWRAVRYAVAMGLLSILLNILFVLYLHMGLQGVYVAALVAAVINLVMGIWVLRDWVSPRHFDFQRLIEMLHYSLPLVPSALAFWIVDFADRAIVQHYWGTSEVGLYQIGASLAGLTALFTGAFQQAWAAFAFSIQQKPEAKRVYALVMEIFLLSGCFAALGLSLFATEALRLFTTPVYYGAYSVVCFLALGYLMTGLYQIAALGANLAKKTAPIGIAITVAALVNTGLNFILIPRWGRMGAAIATLASQVIVPIYLFWESQRLYPIPYRLWVAAVVPSGTLALMMVGNLVANASWYLAVPVKVGLLLLYAPLVLILPQVRERVQTRFRRTSQAS